MRIKTDGDRDGNVQDQQVLVIRNLGSENHARVSDCLTVYNFSLDGATPTSSTSTCYRRFLFEGGRYTAQRSS